MAKSLESIFEQKVKLSSDDYTKYKTTFESLFEQKIRLHSLDCTRNKEISFKSTFEQQVRQ